MQSRLSLSVPLAPELQSTFLQGRHWVLDPIDGTRGFVGQRQYAICLGLLDEGEVKLLIHKQIPTDVVQPSSFKLSES